MTQSRSYRNITSDKGSGVYAHVFFRKSEKWFGYGGLVLRPGRSAVTQLSQAQRASGTSIFGKDESEKGYIKIPR